MISERLLKIAEMIEKDKVVFDVGSDHALLPCFLVNNNITDKVYAGEVAKGPYQKVLDTIEKNNLNGKVIPVFSDGLDEAPDDVEVVVIAGMGYYTIEHILNNTDVNKYEYFIIQSNTDVDKLRKYISDHGYTITDEKIVKDGFYYQIVKFNGNNHEPYSDMEIKYGPINIERMDDIFVEYLKDYKNRLEEINVRANKEEYCSTIKEIESLLV